ncbi:MAG: hypothetical protein IJ265_07360 [Oscillospiraceae bacterium]|nr:hypothetical protein [Oscillospiraceae bacterium]
MCRPFRRQANWEVICLRRLAAWIEPILRTNNLKQKYEKGSVYPELFISNYDTSEREKMGLQLSFFDENGGLF